MRRRKGDERALTSVVEDLVEDGSIADPKSARGRLLATAAHLFREKGYDRTTVRDLAGALGIQSGSLFHHYKTKEDILIAVMEETIAVSTERLRRGVDPESPPRERLVQLIHCELQGILGETSDALAVLVYEWKRLSGEARDTLMVARAGYEALWMACLEELEQADELTMEAPVARKLLIGALSWTFNWFDDQGVLTGYELAERASRMFLKPQS